MAKQRWLVRGYGLLAETAAKEACYFVYRGAKPRKLIRGSWPRHRTYMLVGPKTLHALRPPRFHLAPGDGPVLLGEW